MIELTLLATLLTEHNASHWEMSCSDWNKNRIEILSDKNLNSDRNNPDKSEQLEITRVVVAHTDPMCFKSKDAKAD